MRVYIEEDDDDNDNDGDDDDDYGDFDDKNVYDDYNRSSFQNGEMKRPILF